jgi:hypothetical protein
MYRPVAADSFTGGRRRKAGNSARQRPILADSRLSVNVDVQRPKSPAGPSFGERDERRPRVSGLGGCGALLFHYRQKAGSLGRLLQGFSATISPTLDMAYAFGCISCFKAQQCGLLTVPCGAVFVSWYTSAYMAGGVRWRITRFGLRSGAIGIRRRVTWRILTHSWPARSLLLQGRACF